MNPLDELRALQRVRSSPPPDAGRQYLLDMTTAQATASTEGSTSNTPRRDEPATAEPQIMVAAA